MYRSLLALFAAAPLPAAPGPKDGAKEALYFPVTVGAKSVMEMTVSGTPMGPAMKSVVTVTKVDEKDGKFRVTVERASPGNPVAENLVLVLEVSGRGLALVAAGGKDLDKPVVLVKLPAKPGDTWTNEDPRAGKVTVTVGKEEDVEVPAGKYKALVVVSEMNPGGRPAKTTSWYAAGVGLVKSVTTYNGFDTTDVLKSFTPGK